MSIADIDRHKAPLRHSSPTEALRVAPAVERAGVAEGAAVFVAGAELDVTARRRVYLPGITLRLSDGQNGERERRQKGCIPRPANRRTPPTRVTRVGALRRSGGQSSSARDKLYTIAPAAMPVPCPPSYPRPNSVIPALAAGISMCAAPTHLVISPSRLARFSVVPPLVLQAALGLGSRSSLGRRIPRAGVGSAHERRRRLGADSRSGAGMTRKRGGGNDEWVAGVRKGDWVLCSARYPRQARV